MKQDSILRNALLTGAGWLAALAGTLPAQDDSNGIPTLEPYVVTPTRFPVSPEDVGSAITMIPASDLEARQVRTVEQALQLAPGVAFATTGQRGSTSSVFLRGVNSNQTQFLIDGIRVSDSNLLPNNFLGGAMAHNLRAIEVLRGPQSALYGGEAIGGVISLWSPRGEGAPSSEFDVLAGSFGTLATGLRSSGELGPLAYSLSLGWETTENDRPNNGFDNLYYATRFDWALGDRTTLGFTVRGANREYGSPGSTAENDPDNTDSEDFLLLTLYLEQDLTEMWDTRFTAGLVQQDLEFDTRPFGSSGIDNEKVVLDWRNTFAWDGGHTSLFGVGYEHNSVVNSGFGAIDATESLFSLYAQQLLEVGEALSLTGGVRWEDYDTFGDALTWRGAGAWKVAATGTTLRASAGTGFRAPSFFELFARSDSFTGNPELQPEESLGWDVGFSQPVGELGTLGVTWFTNELEQLITTDFAVFPSTVVNQERATTSGLEVEWNGQLLNDILAYQLAYTYLEAENDTTGERLLRRPKHTLGFDLRADVTDRFSVGMGGYWLDNRLDVDPVSFGTIAGDDYFLARIYGNYALRENLDLHLRVENAFDQDYEEVAGFPGRGLGIFGGVKLRF